MSYPNYSWTSAFGREMREGRARAEAERLIHGLNAHVATCELTRDLGADTNCLVCQAHAFIKSLMADALPPAPEVKDPIASTVRAELEPLADQLTEMGHKFAKGEMCNATDPTTGYLCCLVKQHPGPHIATDADETKLRGTVAAQWSNEEAPA